MLQPFRCIDLNCFGITLQRDTDELDVQHRNEDLDGDGISRLYCQSFSSGTRVRVRHQAQCLEPGDRFEVGRLRSQVLSKFVSRAWSSVDLIAREWMPSAPFAGQCDNQPVRGARTAICRAHRNECKSLKELRVERCGSSNGFSDGGFAVSWRQHLFSRFVPLAS
jgi:hypothetical protein